MQRVNIAIASPGDVTKERDAVLKVFNRWNDANTHAMLHSVSWEASSVPTMGDHPQHILNKDIIDKSDLLVAILWSKLGTPTPTAKSGTVEEIREFITQKGPKRVMLYFCTRSFPHDIDLLELARLREFESEMKTQGLFHQYKTVSEFERDLYRHLDVKVQQLVSNELPIPSNVVTSDGIDIPATNQHPDPRLRQPVNFGSKIDEIAKRFAERMDEFDAIGGATADKYLDLGAHIYTSAASCLDRFLAYSAGNLSVENRMVFESISTRLKQLAASSDTYLKKPFSQYWIDGRKISGDLIAHVEHINRLRRT